ncbi:MAG: nucleoside monophosphate kinase [Phycisphaerales bacterium]|jgi:adenylate kinase|nr:nucleoside monophosphate kinase [Phycisphaerales bacterium]MDP6311988.1 nucleoside monophosphate kinase [Phycisphaerales bacterium]MDP7086758.1 nucleoside monophosphate kinase [Phycisphaerales bacterium]MDP7189187.1 nucleoside monophosphate kinase [Phycisphaerales bacterium]MDP7519462.1 nucleoside monophosphate kinase [Phycisphaerales bacterium]|tara:strand:+ start:8136 stop:8753 length:618 start_codon:yes stop_codon:yes gene_type:complete
MATPLKTILLFGQPGVGKGTQGEILGTIPGFVHLATGDMFRGLDRDSELGQEFLRYSTQGLLVPDDLTIRLWRQYVQGLIDTNSYRPDTDLLVLDGIPRSAGQASMIDEYIDVLRVVHLTCPDTDALVARIQQRAVHSGRPDDADEAVIRRRIDVYHEETSPVLDFYDNSLIANIDAVGLPGEILMHILDEIVPAARGQVGNPFG